MSRLIVTTGGTGGHIFPALAVAEEARRRDPACQVLFAGGAGPERAMAERAGLPFAELPARGVLGKGLSGLLGSVWVVRAVAGALGVIRRFSPEAVIGFGGYAGLSPVLAARMRGVPTAIHEQNSVPGAANRVLGRLVRRVFLSFPDAHRAFAPEKCTLTGNPVRRDILSLPERTPENSAKATRRLLVLGGSQGARAINDAVIEALPRLREQGVEVLHQAGRADEPRVRAAYREAGWDEGCVHGFMDDMPAAYAWADLALCRSGASTVFELAAASLPSVLVPFPHATHDHQSVNAGALEDAGAALRLAQEGLDGEQVALLTKTLFENTDKLARMARAAREFSRPFAASEIMDGVEALVNARNEEEA